MEKTESIIDSGPGKARFEKEKRWLWTYQNIARERRQIETMLAEVEAAMQGPKVQRLDGMPRGGTPDGGSATEMLVAKHIELQRRYQEKLEAMAATQLEIEQAIEALDPTARLLLRCRYLEGLKWEEVCVRLNYSWRQTHRLHSEALRKLRETRAS